MIANAAWTLLVTAAAATAAAVCQSDEFRLTVLHTNDLHSHFDETCRGADGGGPCLGGFARLRGALDAERARAAADGAPAVYLHAGDTFQGTSFYNVLGWEPAADFMGGLGVDAMCLGNHEFEDGPEGLAPFLKSKNISSIPIVCANINTEGEPILANLIRPSTVLTVGGHTVGVIGYLTTDAKVINMLGKVDVTDEVQSIKAEVAKLKASGVEFIIALGHSGLGVDQRVAREVDGVDVVVGGHSHSYLFSGKPQDTEISVGSYPIIEKRGDQIVPVVQASAFAKYLGKLVLTFNCEKRLISAVGGPILLDQTIPQDSNTLKKVEYYKTLLAKKQVHEVVGKTMVFLDGDCKCSETNLCDLIADSYIHFNVRQLLKNNVTLTGWTDAAIAITIKSSVQSSINTSETNGDIYNQDVERTLPYKTPLFKVIITGRTIVKALEHSATSYDYKNCAMPEQSIFGNFIHVSGMLITYNMKKAAGSRVQSVEVRCAECKVPMFEPIDPGKQYTVILSKYIALGGDQFKMIQDGIIKTTDMNVTESEAFLDYVKEMRPIYAGVENRVKILK